MHEIRWVGFYGPVNVILMLSYTGRMHAIAACSGKISKLMVISKCCQNFGTKHFQRNVHNTCLENAIKSPTVPYINQAYSS
jgi:hypothetical protein